MLPDTTTGQGEIHEQPREEIAYAFRALVMGTRDYANAAQKALVGLRRNSAVVAAIAVEASRENVGADAWAVFVGRQRCGCQSGGRNRNQLKTIPISPVFDAYRAALKPVLVAQPDDRRNIQARIRGNYLMALSNKFGSMVLSTGNKSELAVGYCTLYGTCRRVGGDSDAETDGV